MAKCILYIEGFIIAVEWVILCSVAFIHLSVQPSRFVRHKLCTTGYRTMLWTADLRCAPWYTMGTYVCEKWGSPPTWCSRELFPGRMTTYIQRWGSGTILHVRYQLFFDGIQGSVVSLDVCPSKPSQHQTVPLGTGLCFTHLAMKVRAYEPIL